MSDDEYDPYYNGISQRNATQGAQVLMIESTKAMPLIVVLCVLVGLAIGISLWSLSYADKARMESRLLQVKVEGFEKALWAAKIDPNPHLPGQPE